MRPLLGLLLISLLPARLVAAQPPPEATPLATWGPNGPVHALARVGNRLFVGGSFDVIGPPVGGFAVMSGADASLESRFVTPGLVGHVVSDGDGGWYMSHGNMSGLVDGVLHVGANGVTDPAWTPPRPNSGNIVSEVALAAGRLYIAGSFSTINGEARTRLAALDASTGALLPWNPHLGGLTMDVFFSVVAVDDTIIVRGGFDTVNGAPRASGVAAFDAATGALLPLQVPAWSKQFARVAALPGRLFQAGIGCGTTASAGVCARDLTDGHLLWEWTAGGVGAIYASADRVFVNAGPGNHRLVALDAVTGVEVPWSPPAVDVHVMTADATRLYLMGTTASAPTILTVLALDRVSGAVIGWDPVVGGVVGSMAVADGHVALGGTLASAGGLRRKYLAAIDLTTGRAVPEIPDAPTPIYALATIGDVVVAGGGHPTPLGAEGSVFAFSATTGAMLPWSLTANGEVQALAAGGGALYLGGRFTQLSGQARERLAAVDLASGQLLAWNPGLPLMVRELSVGTTGLYAGGTPVGFGIRAAAFDLRTRDRLPFSPTPSDDYDVRQFAIWRDRVLATGVVWPSPRRVGVSWLDPLTGVPQGDIVLPIFPTTAAAAGDTVVVGGRLESTGVKGLVAFDAPTGTLLPWQAVVADGWFGVTAVNTIAGGSDFFAVGGSFTVAAGEPVNNLAVFRTGRTPAPRRLTAAVAGPTVTLGWQSAGAPEPESYIVEAGTSAGATDVGVFSVGTATQVTGALSPGTYYTRVRGVAANGAGPASSEVIFSLPATATAPSPPGTLTSSVANGVVTLAWSAAAGNAATYVLDVGTQSGATNIGSLPLGHLDTTFTTPAPSGVYFVRVRAVNAHGSSAPSNEVQVVVP